MGFNSVYRVLQEVFPEVDSRILRAVAIEHSKDADAAVEAVLVEVIPRLSQQSLTHTSSNKSPTPSNDGGKTVENEMTVDSVDAISSFSKLSTEAGPSRTYSSLPDATEVLDADNPTIVDPIVLQSAGICSYLVSDECGDRNNIIIPDSVSPAAISETDSHDKNDEGSVEAVGEKVESLGDSVVTDAGSYHEETETVIAPESSKLVGICETHSAEVQELDLNSSSTTTSEKDDSVIQLVDSEDESIHDESEALYASESSHLVGICETDLAVTQELNLNSSSLSTTSEKDDSVVQLVDPDDESIMASMLTRSDQQCSTQLLEEIIEDARNNKKTLVLTMDSVVNLMKEVESKEKAADEAKEVATRDCSHVYAKVEDLKQALVRAKEANDMHSGEVYAEKAILATELKELQLRLFTLSDETNESLEILAEMRSGLEVRLTRAIKEIEAAKEEKMGKEKSAKEALLYQESEMEKVVEESKKLKLEAEENSKLQEFLMDRGRAIDMLQGEISVKCQDVRVLKDKLEKRIPLSRSVSCSQTSAISTSSFRSTVTVTPSEPEIYGTPKTVAELADSYGFLNKSLTSGSGSGESQMETTASIEEKHDDDRSKQLLDGEWELFDKDDFCLGA